MNMKQFDIYSALRVMKKHMLNRNYGLMEQELDALGMKLEEEIKPVKGLRWHEVPGGVGR